MLSTAFKKSISFLLCVVICAVSTVNISVYAKEGLTVPKIEINTENGNGCSLEKSDGYVNAEISITDTAGSVLSDAVLLKVRGNSSGSTWVSKKSFTFKFEKKQKVLNLGKGKKWALISNVFDKTLLRNRVAFETAYELELPYASRQSYAELWLDGVYRGCYAVFEPVQKGEDRVDIDVDGNNGMKDFMVEYEYSRVDEGDTYFTAEGLRFRVSEPEEPDDEQLEYIKGTMTDIIKTLKSRVRSDIETKIDMSSFVKFYLLNEYFKTFDFSFSSVYYYYKDGKLHAGPPWDYDLSMGDANDGYSDRCTKAYSPEGIFITAHLYSDLSSMDWFRELVRAEYEEHYDFFAAIHTDGGLLDTLRSDYGRLFDKNYSQTGWRVNGTTMTLQRTPDKTYEGNYNYLKNWLAQRHIWFDDYFQVFVKDCFVGDVDLDEKVDINDATLLQQRLAGIDAFSDTLLPLADTDGDDNVDISDVTVIQLYLVDIFATYKVGEIKTVRTK